MRTTKKLSRAKVTEKNKRLKKKKETNVKASDRFTFKRKPCAEDRKYKISNVEDKENVLQTYASIIKSSNPRIVLCNIANTELIKLIPMKQRLRFLKTKSKHPVSETNLQNNLHSNLPILYDLRQKPLKDKQVKCITDQSLPRRYPSRNKERNQRISESEGRSVFESNEERKLKITPKTTVVENVQRYVKSWCTASGPMKECFVKLTPIAKSKGQGKKIIENSIIPIENIASSQCTLNSTSPDVNFDSLLDKVNGPSSNHRQLTMDKLRKSSDTKETVTSKQDTTLKLRRKRKANTLDNMLPSTSVENRLKSSVLMEVRSKSNATKLSEKKLFPIVIDNNIFPKDTMNLSSILRQPVDMKVPIISEKTNYNRKHSLENNGTTVGNTPCEHFETLKEVKLKSNVNLSTNFYSTDTITCDDNKNKSNEKANMTKNYPKRKYSKIHDYRCNDKVNKNFLDNEKSNIAYDTLIEADDKDLKMMEKPRSIDKLKEILNDSDTESIEMKLYKANTTWKTYPEIATLLQEDANNNNNNNKNTLNSKERINFDEDVSNNNSKGTPSNKTVVRSNRSSAFRKITFEENTEEVTADTKKHMPIITDNCIQNDAFTKLSNLQNSNLLINSKSMNKSKNNNIIITSNFKKAKKVQDELFFESSATDIEETVHDAKRLKESLEKASTNLTAKNLTKFYSIVDNCGESGNAKISLDQTIESENTASKFSEQRDHRECSNKKISEVSLSRKCKLTQESEKTRFVLTDKKKRKLNRNSFTKETQFNKSNHNTFSYPASAFTRSPYSSNMNVEIENQVSNCTVAQSYDKNCISITSTVENANALNINLNNNKNLTEQSLIQISNVNTEQKKLRNNSDICSDTLPKLGLNNYNYGQRGVNGNNGLKKAADNIFEKTDLLCFSSEQNEIDRCTLSSPSQFLNESTEKIINDTKEDAHKSTSNTSNTKECNEDSVESNVQITISSITSKNDTAVIEKSKDNNTTEYDDEDDDCISLFAESFTVEMCENDTRYDPSVLKESITNENCNDHTLHLTHDKNDDHYFNKNKNECEQDFKSFSEKDNSQVTFSRENYANYKIPRINRDSSALIYNATDAVVPLCDTTSTSATNARSRIGNNSSPKRKAVDTNRFFYKYCFSKLKRGTCDKGNCNFFHSLDALLRYHLAQNQEIISNIIDDALLARFCFYLKQLYPQLLQKVNCIYIIDLFQKMHNAELMNRKLITDTIKALLREKLSFSTIVNKLANLVKQNDNITPLYILEIIKHEISPGYYWNTFRNLFLKKVPPKFHVEAVLRECVETKKSKFHIKDICDNLLCELTPDQLSKIDINLMTAFNDLLQNENVCTTNDTGTNNSQIISSSKSPVSPIDTNISTLSTTKFYDDNECQKSIQNISLPDTTQHFDMYLDHRAKAMHVYRKSSPETRPSNESEIHSSTSTLTLNPVLLDTKINSKKKSSEELRDERSLNHKQNNSSTSNGTVSTLNQPIAFQEQFQKFNLQMKQIIMAELERNNYKFIIDILNNCSGKDQHSFINCLYHLLCKETMQAEHHLTNIIQLTVRTGINVVLGEMLFTLGTYVLTNLADAGAWVLAYKLLKSVRTCSQTNATFTLLSAEIYLANQRPLKAFAILQQSNIIFTNRNKWRVTNDVKDEYLRTKIVSFLLEMFCEEFEECAFTLFEFLLEDQISIYKPIDLSHYVDKVALGLLKRKQIDLILNIGRLIIHHNFIVQTRIHRAIIICAIRSDIVLAKQLYQYATSFGIYYTIKLNSPTYVLINCHWSKEEMYLTMLELVKKLLTNIGHAIDRLRSCQLSVYLIFEIMPTGGQFYSNEFYNRHQIKASKMLMKNILRQKFNPSIEMIKKDQGKLAKLNSCSLVNHLKSNVG